VGIEIGITSKEDIPAFAAAQVQQNEDLQIVIDGDSRWLAHFISGIEANSSDERQAPCLTNAQGHSL
jgi:hypothetical protein